MPCLLSQENKSDKDTHKCCNIRVHFEYAQTIHTFVMATKGSKYLLIVPMVFVYSAGNDDTKSIKGSRGDCEYKKHGSCKSKSQMLSEIESKVRSGEYWR